MPFPVNALILMGLLWIAGPSHAANELQRESLKSLGYRPWVWGGSECEDCSLAILPTNIQIETPEVYAFIKVIEEEKYALLHIYDSATSQEYNLLAHMAVGILGSESKFYQSRRYQLKEAAPAVISAMKVAQAYVEYYSRKAYRSWNWESLSPAEKARDEKDRPRFSNSSRGPTQIKTLPEAIAKNYGVTADSLYRPEHAAVATMGYLLEALSELKRRIVKDDLYYVNESNYVDYLPYIYFGSRWQLMWDKSGPEQKVAAEPWKNLYIMGMKRYMNWVEVYEAPPQKALPR